jgi:hypothetical protein
MSKEKPDYQDADLVLRLYEMRREAVMRESRHAINSTFWPQNYNELLEITKPDHHLNASFRQTATYWEMVFGLAKHGIANADYLVESSGEGLNLFAKIAPYLEQFRKDYSPIAFQNAEWITKNSELGKFYFEAISDRVQKALKAREK